MTQGVQNEWRANAPKRSLAKPVFISHHYPPALTFCFSASSDQVCIRLLSSAKSDASAIVTSHPLLSGENPARLWTHPLQVIGSTRATNRLKQKAVIVVVVAYSASPSVHQVEQWKRKWKTRVQCIRLRVIRAAPQEAGKIQLTTNVHAICEAKRSDDSALQQNPFRRENEQINL